MFNRTYVPKTGEYVKAASKLDFISVGVCDEDPSDIEYRYVVDCGKIDPKSGLPEVKAYEVSCDSENKWSQTEVTIPKGKNKWAA